jgi:RNA polymerase sigma factor (sigma-70 family)
MARNVGDLLVRFQENGKGFEEVWAEIGPIVGEFARRSLRNLGVRRPGGDDDWAVDDVVNQTVVRLMGLAKPGTGGRFDPAKAKPGLSGVRGWLWRVVENQSVEWHRSFRGGRGVKILPASDLDWNELPSGDEGGTIVERKAAKVERADLLPILELCIDQLPEPFMRDVVRLKLDRECSERDTAKALDVPVSRVHRCLRHAYEFLRPMLESHGADAAWLAA